MPADIPKETRQPPVRTAVPRGTAWQNRVLLKPTERFSENLKNISTNLAARFHADAASLLELCATLSDKNVWGVRVLCGLPEGWAFAPTPTCDIPPQKTDHWE